MAELFNVDAIHVESRSTLMVLQSRHGSLPFIRKPNCQWNIEKPANLFAGRVAVTAKRYGDYPIKKIQATPPEKEAMAFTASFVIQLTPLTGDALRPQWLKLSTVFWQT